MHKNSHSQVRAILIAGIFLVQLAAVLFISPEGYFSIDEGVYHLMANAFFQDGSLAIKNGHDLFPSTGWQIDIGPYEHVPLRFERLVSIYPPGFIFLVAPTYTFLGFRAFYLVNLLCFWGSLYLTYQIARRFFSEDAIATLSVLILGLSTFFWDYSMAGWPHIASAFFILFVFYLVIQVEKSESNFQLFIAGVVGGLAVSIRLDIFFGLAAIGLAIPHLRISSLKEKCLRCLFYGSGIVLSLSPLIAINYWKFGIPSPLTYGSNTSILKHFPILNLFVIGGLAILFFPSNKSRKIIYSYLLVIVLCLLIIPFIFYDELKSVLRGMYGLLLFFDSSYLSAVEAEGYGTEFGAVTYLGGLKRALFQSSPILIFFILPFLRKEILQRYSKQLILLLVIPCVFVFFFSFRAWHGRASLSMRYFIPILPFLAILSAVGLHDLKLPSSKVRMVFLSILLILFVPVLATFSNSELATHYFLLELPFYFCALFLLITLAYAIHGGRALQGMLLLSAMAFGVYSFVSTITNDVTAQIKTRMMSQEIIHFLEAQIPRDSIIISEPLPESITSSFRLASPVFNPRYLEASEVSVALEQFQNKRVFVLSLLTHSGEHRFPHPIFQSLQLEQQGALDNSIRLYEYSPDSAKIDKNHDGP